VSKAHLSTYLNDHLAGANFALEILEHLHTENSDLMKSLAALRTDIEQDREQLKTLMARLDIEESRVRKATGWLAEQFAEVKLYAEDEDGAMRRLERLESLAIGIEGKIALWKALDAAAPMNSELGGLNYEELGSRGQDQRERVEVLRIAASRAALSA
jgi:hypothetical protein